MISWAFKKEHYKLFGNQQCVQKQKSRAPKQWVHTSPCLLNMRPVTKPRPPCADGLSIYSHGKQQEPQYLTWTRYFVSVSDEEMDNFLPRTATSHQPSQVCGTRSCRAGNSSGMNKQKVAELIIGITTVNSTKNSRVIETEWVCLQTLLPVRIQADTRIK